MLHILKQKRAKVSVKSETLSLGKLEPSNVTSYCRCANASDVVEMEVWKLWRQDKDNTSIFKLVPATMDNINWDYSQDNKVKN